MLRQKVRRRGREAKIISSIVADRHGVQVGDRKRGNRSNTIQRIYYRLGELHESLPDCGISRVGEGNTIFLKMTHFILFRSIRRRRFIELIF